MCFKKISKKVSRVFHECVNEVMNELCNFVGARIPSQLPKQKEGLLKLKKKMDIVTAIPNFTLISPICYLNIIKITAMNKSNNFNF